MKVARLAIGLVVTASIGALLAAPAQAYQVVAFPDVDSAPMGGCALREAIESLHNGTPVDTCVLAGTPGNNEILLAQGVHTFPILLNGSGDDVDATGDFDIRDNLTITGSGADQSTIDAQNRDRVFDVMTGVSLTLRNLTVTGGKAPNGALNSGAGGERGGGIRATGTLTLDNVVVTGNTAGSGGSGANGNPGQAGGFGGEGGGIYAVGFLTITNSVISNNDAGSGGAGGSASGACTTVTNGGAGGGGGGGGGLTAGNGAMITGSTITGNSSGIGGGGGCASTPGAGGNGGSGGGILAVGLTLTNSVVSDNQTRNGGKAAQDFDSANNTGSGRGGDGGGVWASSATISGSTISGNITGGGNGNAPGTTQNSGGTQSGDGGGALLSGAGSVVDSTFSGNSTGLGASSTDNFAGQGGNGGGLAITDSDIFAGSGYTISRSTFNDNFTGPGGNSGTQPGDGGSGGAIFVGNTNTIRTVSVSDSTFTGNHTGAGGNRTTAGGFGGNGGRGGALGIGNTTNATFTHLTVAANTTGDGGTTGAGGTPGTRSDGGAIDVSSSFQASTATVQNSILSANVPATCAVSNGTLTDGGHNLVFGTQCTDITATSTADPLLAAPANNGGKTQTMAIGDASPARDIVPSSGSGCTATDQRGTTRPQGTACDAGAFEIFVPPPPDTGGGGGGTGGDQPPATGGEQPPVVDVTLPKDVTPPVIKLLLRKQKLLKALKKGYLAFFDDNETGTASADLFASGKDAKGTAARRKRVAHGTLKITNSGKQKLVLKFTKKAKKAFKTRKKVTLQLVLTAKDGAGNATKKTAKVVLKR